MHFITIKILYFVILIFKVKYPRLKFLLCKSQIIVNKTCDIMLNDNLLKTPYNIVKKKKKNTNNLYFNTFNNQLIQGD